MEGSLTILEKRNRENWRSVFELEYQNIEGFEFKDLPKEILPTIMVNTKARCLINKVYENVIEVLTNNELFRRTL
jgi:hypothetical protein